MIRDSTTSDGARSDSSVIERRTASRIEVDDALYEVQLTGSRVPGITTQLLDIGRGGARVDYRPLLQAGDELHFSIPGIEPLAAPRPCKVAYVDKRSGSVGLGFANNIDPEVLASLSRTSPGANVKIDDMSTVFAIFHERDVPAEDRVRAMIAAIRSILRLGPAILYIRDWREPANTAQGAQYRLFHMDGVECTAPMYGRLPNRVRRWIRSGRSTEVVLSEEDHINLCGTRSRFWQRESVTGYIKIAIGSNWSPDGYLVANFGSAAINVNNALRILGCTTALLQSLLPQLIVPTPQQKEMHGERMRQLESLMATVALTTTREQGEETLLCEILLAAQSSLKRSGVLASLHKLERRRGPQLWLRHVTHCGVPDELLHTRRDVFGMRPGIHPEITNDIRVTQIDFPDAEHKGILRWVAASGTALLITDINSPEYRNRKFDVAAMYRSCWQGTCSEICIPLVDPDSDESIYGVLNFESRNVAAFSPDDVYYLEKFASQAAILLKRARHQQVVHAIREAASQGDATTAEAFQKRIGPRISGFTACDGVVLWAPRESKRGAKAVYDLKATHFLSDRLRKAVVNKGTPRDRGWTARIAEMSEKTPVAILVNVFPTALMQTVVLGDDPGRETIYECDGNVSFTARRISFDAEGTSPIRRSSMSRGECPDPSPAIVEAATRTQLGFPLVTAQDGCIGVLWLQWQDLRVSDSFSDEELRWLFSLCAQLGSAMHRSRLLERRYMSGFGHDLSQEVLPAILRLGVSARIDGVKLFAEYLENIMSAYKGNYPKPTSGCILASPDDVTDSVEALVLKGVCVGLTDFARYDAKRIYAPEGGFFSEIQVGELGAAGLAGDHQERYGGYLMVIAANLTANARLHGQEESVCLRGRISSDSGKGRLVITITNLLGVNEDPRQVTSEYLARRSRESGGLFLVRHITERLFGGSFTIGVENSCVTAEVGIPVVYRN